MHWTEEAIRKTLDGWFVSVNNFTGEIEERRVAFNFMPTHKSSFQSDYSKLSNALKLAKANPWTEDEDEMMLAMRSRGVKWCSIRKMMHRGEKAIKERYLVICKERGIEPLLSNSLSAPPLTNEAKAEIISLRKQGFTPSEVAEMTGRPGYQILDYYNRFLASKRMPEVA